MDDDTPQPDIYYRRGFPNAAQNGKVDYGLNVNDLILANPSSTYFMKVESDQYLDLGVSMGDYIAIDRAAESRDDSLIVGHVDGDFVLARQSDLQSDETIKWGVVTWILRPTMPDGGKK